MKNKLPSKLVITDDDLEKYNYDLFERLCEALSDLVVDKGKHNTDSYSWSMKIVIDDICWSDEDYD